MVYRGIQSMPINNMNLVIFTKRDWKYIIVEATYNENIRNNGLKPIIYLFEIGEAYDKKKN